MVLKSGRGLEKEVNLADSDFDTIVKSDLDGWADFTRVTLRTFDSSIAGVSYIVSTIAQEFTKYL